MSLLSRMRTLAPSKDITISRMRIELLPNGKHLVFDYGSKMSCTIDMQGNITGGSLPLTTAQIRALTGIQV